MSKGTPKKSQSSRGPERRKRARKSASSRASVPVELKAEACQNCAKQLAKDSRALFVEEEVGRIFCTEDCITAYFGPDIERLEKQYFEALSTSDLTVKDREKYAHLRHVTLQEPDEVWREKTLSGDNRFTLISEFQPGSKPIWCVCICLFLRGEPSFLYLSFPTKNAALVNQYRRGEQVQWVKPNQKPSTTPHRGKKTGASSAPAGQDEDTDVEEVIAPVIDGLADAWTEEETMRAQLSGERRADDIPSADYALYEAHLNETLEAPTELWRIQLTSHKVLPVYHFIREYEDSWYLIVAQETEEDDQIEILDAFPTRDPDLVQQYRRGEQELGETQAAEPKRMVH